MNADIASATHPSEPKVSGALLRRFLFPAAAAAVLLPFVSPGAALLLGMLIALTVGNPYALEASRFITPLLQISVIGLGAGMNLAVVGRVGVHGFVYTVSSGQFTSEDDPNGVGSTIVNGINDNGVLVGFYGAAPINSGFVAMPH